MRLFWRLRNGTEISYAKFVRCISNYFWEGAATKIPEKIKSVGFVSGARLCHEHKMSETTNNFFFARKPKMVYITFGCYHSNPARTRALSALPGPGQCRPQQPSGPRCASILLISSCSRRWSTEWFKLLSFKK
jgi:hypothetical protein